MQPWSLRCKRKGALTSNVEQWDKLLWCSDKTRTARNLVAVVKLTFITHEKVTVHFKTIRICFVPTLLPYFSFVFFQIPEIVSKIPKKWFLEHYQMVYACIIEFVLRTIYWIKAIKSLWLWDIAGDRHLICSWKICLWCVKKKKIRNPCSKVQLLSSQEEILYHNMFILCTITVALLPFLINLQHRLFCYWDFSYKLFNPWSNLQEEESTNFYWV